MTIVTIVPQVPKRNTYTIDDLPQGTLIHYDNAWYMLLDENDEERRFATRLCDGYLIRLTDTELNESDVIHANTYSIHIVRNNQ